jgi:hypothetical protein
MNSREKEGVVLPKLNENGFHEVLASNTCQVSTSFR